MKTLLAAIVVLVGVGTAEAGCPGGQCGFPTYYPAAQSYSYAPQAYYQAGPPYGYYRASPYVYGYQLATPTYGYGLQSAWPTYQSAPSTCTSGYCPR